MFYETAKNDHGLPRDPFKAIVVPRPIGWISSISAKGEINLAPYSFFNAVSEEPPMVMFSSGGRKDTIAFIDETREFVCNFANFALREAVSKTGAEFPRGVNEMIEAGLEPAPSRLVRPPRVAAAPCALECKLLQIVDLRDLDGRTSQRYVVFGQVVGVHIDDRFIKDGRLDTAAMQPIARCGYNDYAVVDKVFAMVRPRLARHSPKSDSLKSHSLKPEAAE
jgi:flavin reductase (DIM6/NTAB) family NADH-FMN oxidoreductase RutF